MTGTSGTGTTGTSGTGASGTGTTGTSGTGSMTTAGTGGGTSGTGGTATGNGFKMCGKPAKEGMCKAKAPGVYGMKVDVDVWYMDENNNPALYDPGRGTISIFLKGDLTDVCEDGSGGVGTIQTCGDVIPPLLVSLTCGVIQIVFPDDMWEKPMMPKILTTGSSTGFNPMDVLSFAKASGIYGIEMADPAAKWPTYMETANYTCKDGKKGTACWPDHDGDSNPGITVKIKMDGTPGPQPYECPIRPWFYTSAPVGLLEALDPEAGATETYIGLRTAIAGGGKIGADCMSGSGPAEATAFESRLIDCKLKSGGKCSVAQSEFVDLNLPNFHVLQAGEMPPANWAQMANAAVNRMPSKGPQGAMVRLGDPGAAVTCEQVRKATFPAFN
ncbi:MAG TPA: hypothetical protein VJR89_41355 [Polyangiales bacterium]|nr:hypothetical protein [Polyangiales bacterium]